ncbi:DUF4349 domain-containing protein [Limnoglobus roseus]|uniref:DUF4349 domain-containing protein n=1 Tax=Limnoglobus roseus TaxID=2598579 RepID=A0A5C1AGX6_9BACT|nr:DUF4349 domain-containing protein [Limnoglobus roseus]QEL18070.1 hypothetical protein PX52LOC_05084 [Limnoglobus roseus]
MLHRSACVIALFVVTFASGCSGPPGNSPAAAKKAPALDEMKVAPPAAPPAAGGAGNPGPANEVAAERKIIFSGTLDVEVKDFGTAQRELAGLMQKHKAYFAKTEIRGDSGQKRVGTFTIKVPVESFQPLVESLAALGNPLRNTTDSQDVTEEYVDVEARVKNLKAEEEVMNKLLKEVGSRLDDIFKIREQIRTNREQIERAEARLQALGKLTSLSTISLTLRDKEEYVAPTAAKVSEPPSFGERATGTFATSFGMLRSFGETVCLFAIAVFPWLPLILALGGAAWYARRRVLRTAPAAG